MENKSERSEEVEEKENGGKPVIKMTEYQLKHIVACIVETKEKTPQKDKVVVAGEGWQYTFAILLDRTDTINGS